MNRFGYVLVFLAATVVGIFCHRSISGQPHASVPSPDPRHAERAEGISGPSKVDEPRHKQTASTSGKSIPQTSDLDMARAAAEMGRQMLVRAQTTRENAALWKQAAAHFQASLAHESQLPEAAALFQEIRTNLATIDRELTRISQKRIPSTTETTTGVEVSNSKQPAPEDSDELPMFGPDGVPIRRVDMQR